MSKTNIQQNVALTFYSFRNIIQIFQILSKYFVSETLHVFFKILVKCWDPSAQEFGTFIFIEEA